jgi:putative ABC transport system permease protein
VKYLSLILKNGIRNKRRSILTIASVGVSLCLLGVLLAVYAVFYVSEAPPEQALRLVTRNKISLTVTMPGYYRDQIAKMPGVKHVMTANWFGGVYKDQRDPNNFFARFGVEPERLLLVRPEMIMPEDQRQAFVKERTACVLGKPLADKLGIQLGQRIQMKGDIYPVNLELIVRGIFTGDINDEVLYFNQEYLNELLPVARRSNAGSFYVLADSLESANRLGKQIDTVYYNFPVQTKTESEQAFSLAFASSLGNIKKFLLSICAAVMFTVLLVSANTMAMSVRERVKEVGVLKTLGFTTEAVMGIILGEAAVISFLGGLVGCLLASFLCVGLRGAGGFLPQLKQAAITPGVAATTIGAALCIGLISSFIPAWSASRTSIVDALKSNV